MGVLGELDHLLEGILAGHPEGILADHPEGILADHPEGILAGHPEGILADHPEGILADHPEGILAGHPEGILAAPLLVGTLGDSLEGTLAVHWFGRVLADLLVDGLVVHLVEDSPAVHLVEDTQQFDPGGTLVGQVQWGIQAGWLADTLEEVELLAEEQKIHGTTLCWATGCSLLVGSGGTLNLAADTERPGLVGDILWPVEGRVDVRPG